MNRSCDTPKDAPSSRLTLFVFVIAMILALLPIVANQVAPLGDYPGHLARVFILHHLLHGDGFVDMYRFHWSVVPNLAIDAVVLCLMELGVPVEVAGRIFLSMVVALLGTGVVAMHRATFRHWSLWPMLTFPFIYNEFFLYGFVNYLFGLGLAFWIAAWWRHSIDRPVVWLLPLMLLASIVLFFCHLLAVIFLLGLVMSCGIGEIVVRRRPMATLAPWLLTGLVASAVPLLLLSVAPLTAKAKPNLAQLLSHLELSNLVWRARGVLSFAAGYDNLVDGISLACLAFIALYAVTRRGLRLDPGLAIAAIGLFALYLVVPDGWFGTTYLPDRLPTAIAMTGLAGSEIRVMARRTERNMFVALVVALILVRGVTVERAWNAAGAAYRPLLSALDAVPVGARIFSATAYQGDFAPMVRPPFQGMPAYAVIRRGAYFPGVFADPSQNVVVRRPPYDAAPTAPPNLRADKRSSKNPTDSPYAARRLRFYDFVLILHPELWPATPPNLLPIVKAPDYQFFAIAHSCIDYRAD